MLDQGTAATCTDGDSCKRSKTERPSHNQEKAHVERDKLNHNVIVTRGECLTFTAQVLATLNGSANIMDQVRRVAELMEVDKKRMESHESPLIDLDLADVSSNSIRQHQALCVRCIPVHGILLMTVLS